MIIKGATFTDGGEFNKVELSKLTIKNSKINTKICGSLYEVQFEDCVFENAIFDLEQRSEVSFIKCTFNNCTFKNANKYLVYFVLCEKMNEIIFV